MVPIEAVEDVAGGEAVAVVQELALCARGSSVRESMPEPLDGAHELEEARLV